MARQLRVQFEGAIYHVCARGDQRERIVWDEEDCRHMELLWEEIVSKTRWRVFAWVLMGNHYHAVFQTPEPNLVEGMKWVQNTWTKRFNARHSQRGHVFGDRYKSVVCESGDYLRRMIDYVHLNPVRARIIQKEAQLESYPWCSLKDYVLPMRARRSWLDVAGGLAEMGYQDAAAQRREHLTRLNESIDRDAPKSAGLSHMEGQTLSSALQRGWYFGGEEFREELVARLEVLKSKTGGKSRLDAGYNGSQARKVSLRRAKAIKRAGMEVLGLEASNLKALRKGEERKVIIGTVVLMHCGVPLKWVCENLHLGTASYASHLCTGMKTRIKKEKKIRLLANKIAKIAKIHA